HDSLTGLPNRALFMDRLHQALTYCSRHQRQLAVLLLDLNKFKPVNDEYGHAAGDELLKATGESLRKLLRASDTVARLGGDEFVVLLPQLESPLEVGRVAEKITAALSQPFVLSMATVQIGCSIGQALFPDDGSDAEQLIRIADERMYQQKQQRHQGR
ncbi:MAG: diguanylate cyclase domain-containing protein, partial [Chromatiaceae bacterium]